MQYARQQEVPGPDGVRADARGFLPALIHKYDSAKDWVVTQENSEKILAMRRELDDKRWSQRTRDIDGLPVGTLVSIQN